MLPKAIGKNAPSAQEMYYLASESAVGLGGRSQTTPLVQNSTRFPVDNSECVWKRRIVAFWNPIAKIRFDIVNDRNHHWSALAKL
jgi:hypothetical protein